VPSCVESEKVNKESGNFDSLLLDAVDEALQQVFKNAEIQAIYGAVEKKCQLKREEIAAKPEVFSSCLEKVFDSAGIQIQKLIIKNLCRRSKIEYKEKEKFSFSDYLKELEHKMPLKKRRSRREGKKTRKATNLFDAFTSFVTSIKDAEQRKTIIEQVSLHNIILGKLGIGLDVWFLEDKDNQRTFRLVFSNSLAKQITGVARKDFLGETISEISLATLEASFAKACLEVVSFGKAKVLKQIPYCKKDFEGAFSAKAFSILDNCVGIAFEKTAKNRRIETALRKDKKRYLEHSKRLENLIKISAQITNQLNTRKLLKIIANAVHTYGWGKVAIYLLDENLNPTETVAVGLTRKEKQHLKSHKLPSHIWQKHLGSPLEQTVQAFSKEIGNEKTTYSSLNDWLYIPLRLANGEIAGVMSISSPKSFLLTKESLVPLELLAHQVSALIENAKLIQKIRGIKHRLRAHNKLLKKETLERASDLQGSESKLENIFATSPDLIAIADLNGNITECNTKTCEMLGYSSKEELIGKSFLTLVSKKDCQKTIETLRKTLENRPAKNIEHILAAKDGNEFSVELSTAVINDTSNIPSGFLIISKDIAKHKQLEQNLLKYEKLGDIGELAAIVGHDLQNSLTDIITVADYLEEHFGQKMNAEERDKLKNIEKNIECSKKILGHILEYSPEIKLQFTQATPKSLMKQALSLIGIPENVQVIDLTRDEPQIRVDAKKMKIIFASMLRNMIDAIPNGGALTIKSRELSNSVKILFSMIEIDVSKNSLTKQILRKIWKPRFSANTETIEYSLPICRRIIEAHGGKIVVENVAREGTVIAVNIPIEPKTSEETEIWVNIADSLMTTIKR